MLFKVDFLKKFSPFHSDGLNIPLIANVIPMRVLSTTEENSLVSDIFNRDKITQRTQVQIHLV
jgi:hypothetical protein